MCVLHIRQEHQTNAVVIQMIILHARYLAVPEFQELGNLLEVLADLAVLVEENGVQDLGSLVDHDVNFDVVDVVLEAQDPAGVDPHDVVLFEVEAVVPELADDEVLDFDQQQVVALELVSCDYCQVEVTLAFVGEPVHDAAVLEECEAVILAKTTLAESSFDVVKALLNLPDELIGHFCPDIDFINLQLKATDHDLLELTVVH